MVQPKRGHDYFQLTKDVELDYISGHTGLGLTTPGVRLHNTISQFKGKKGAYIIDYHGRHFYVDMKKRHYMDILSIGNKYQKKLNIQDNCDLNGTRLEEVTPCRMLPSALEHL